MSIARIDGQVASDAVERSAGHASSQQGDRVLLVEADRVSGAAMNGAELDEVSRTGRALRN